MAIARLSVKIGARGKAAGHAAYIAREAGFARRGDVEARCAGNMPSWAESRPSAFWEAADANERANGTAYREFEIALPRELSPEQRRELLTEFVRAELGETHPYQWAIHCPPAMDGGEQPHAHIMFSERRNDGHDRTPETYFRRFNRANPEKGGAQKGYGERAGEKLTRAERAAELGGLRTRWETACNSALERAGSAARIDMRSLAERGERRRAEPKQGPKRWHSRRGRELIAELRDAQRVAVQAREELRARMPSGPAVELARQGRGVYAQMPMEKLRAVVARRPATLADRVAADPGLRALVEQARSDRAALRDLERERGAAQQRQAAAAAIEAGYREKNRWRAGLHDRGVQSVRVLTESERTQREAAEQVAALDERIEGQRAAVQTAEAAALQARAALEKEHKAAARADLRKHEAATVALTQREALAELVEDVATAAREGRTPADARAAVLVEAMRNAQRMGSGAEAKERQAVAEALAGRPADVAGLRAAFEGGRERS